LRGGVGGGWMWMEGRVDEGGGGVWVLWWVYS